VRSTEAARVIVTIPFSTLRQVDIRPAFSLEKQRAIEELPYFPATRFLIQSRSRFWHASGLSGTARTDRPAEIWDCTYDLGGEAGILGGTVGGAIGTALLDKSLQECVDFGLETVADAFPGIRSEFALGVAHRWASEPWSRGAFAVFHRGQMASIMPAVPRPEGRVHFAGEHTSSWIGWMEGALLSAERVAEEVMNAS
jgi:monoamine oxidase